MNFCLWIWLGWRTEGRIADRVAGTTAGCTARTNFDLSTGRLAGEKHAEELWPLNRTIERRIPVGFGHRRCRMVAWEVCFDREFELGVFAMGKWLRIVCFPTSAFLIINVFPPLLEKESSNFSTLPFQYSAISSRLLSMAMPKILASGSLVFWNLDIKIWHIQGYHRR